MALDDHVANLPSIDGKAEAIADGDDRAICGEKVRHHGKRPRGDGVDANAWLSSLSPIGDTYLPLLGLTFRLGGKENVPCASYGGLGVQCDDEHPWTHMQYWVRHMTRAGFWDPYGAFWIVGLVPQGWFDELAANYPEVNSRPDLYHNLQTSRVWNYSGFPGISLVEVNGPASAILHALGDRAGRGSR